MTEDDHALFFRFHVLTGLSGALEKEIIALTRLQFAFRDGDGMGFEIF